MPTFKELQKKEPLQELNIKNTTVHKSLSSSNYIRDKERRRGDTHNVNWGAENGPPPKSCTVTRSITTGIADVSFVFQIIDESSSSIENDISIVCDFGKSFYESAESQSQEVVSMRKFRHGKARQGQSQNRQLTPKRRRGNRQSLKRSEDSPSVVSESPSLTMDADDSIIILSPAESRSTSGTTSPKCSGHDTGESTDQLKIENLHVTKRIRLFDSTATSTRSSGNETIDLVDDDDEVILLSDEDLTKSELELPQHKSVIPTPNDSDTTKNEDCEIIGIKVVAAKEPVNTVDTVSRRRSLRNSGKYVADSRKSISYSNVKISVDRAKRCINSFNLTKPSVVSHGIKKNKKKNKKKWKGKQASNISHDEGIEFGFRTPVSMRKSKARLPQRRPTSPVFLLDRELGPARNANFEAIGPRFNSLPSTSRNFLPPPTFIPIGKGLSTRGAGRELRHNPFQWRMPIPQQPVVPVEPNFISVSTNEDPLPGSLRPIVIDGSNVAMGHKGNKTFSCRGIQICVEFFKRRGHEVVAYVPQFRRKQSESTDTDILDSMEKDGTVKFTPSREVAGHRIASYDDRFIVQYAHIKKAIIISNDNFKDIFAENPEWRDTIHFRILQFTWMDESCIMFPRDPMGRGGPNLEDFLRF